MAAGGRRGVYGGWTRSGNARVFVRVPLELKRRSENGASHNGDGPDEELETTPIVLVHGLSSSRTLRPLIRTLGSRRPVFAPDLPGFGMSDPPVRPLTVPELADALRRWMIENDHLPAIVVAVSFGCQVAVDLAARHPTSLEQLVLVGPTLDPEARTRGRLAMRWAKTAARSSPRLAPTVVHDVIDAGPLRGMKTLQAALDDPMEEKLGEIEVPTLVVHRERDQLAPEKWTKRVAKLIPDAQLVELPKAGHAIGTKAAAGLSALITPFLEDGVSEEGETEKESQPA